MTLAFPSELPVLTELVTHVEAQVKESSRSHEDHDLLDPAFGIFAIGVACAGLALRNWKDAPGSTENTMAYINRHKK